MKRTLKLAATALLLAMGVSSAAHASAFSYSLDTPSQSANPGDTVYFYANLQVFNQIFTQNNPPIFINGDTFTADSPLSVDDSWFFIGFPPSINAGDSDDNVLFTVTLPSNIATGTYLGSFSLSGGSDSNANDFLGTDNFEITTVASTSPVPEPSSLALLGSGVVAVLAGRRRKYLRA